MHRLLLRQAGDVCDWRKVQTGLWVSPSEYSAHSTKPSNPSPGSWYYEYVTSQTLTKTVWDIYVPKYETRDYLAGERWVEHVKRGSYWASEPLPVKVVLSSVDGFDGEVALSVYPGGKLSVALRETRVRSLV